MASRSGAVHPYGDNSVAVETNKYAKHLLCRSQHRRRQTGPHSRKIYRSQEVKSEYCQSIQPGIDAGFNQLR